jgi:hypothetical protein
VKGGGKIAHLTRSICNSAAATGRLFSSSRFMARQDRRQ